MIRLSLPLASGRCARLGCLCGIAVNIIDHVQGQPRRVKYRFLLWRSVGVFGDVRMITLERPKRRSVGVCGIEGSMLPEERWGHMLGCPDHRASGNPIVHVGLEIGRRHVLGTEDRDDGKLTLQPKSGPDHPILVVRRGYLPIKSMMRGEAPCDETSGIKTGGHPYSWWPFMNGESCVSMNTHVFVAACTWLQSRFEDRCHVSGRGHMIEEALGHPGRLNAEWFQNGISPACRSADQSPTPLR